VSDLVVRSERVVLPDAVRPAAIHIHDGRIVSLADYEDVPVGATMRDAGELMVLPGFVDTHVHMNDPGRPEWEGVEHATAAAAAGGITTVIDMPLNCIPSTTAVSALAAKRSALAHRCAVDVGFWGGVVPGNAGELSPLARAGVLGFKCFLAPSGVDEFEHVTEADLRGAMPVLASLGLPLLVHAELPAELRPADAARPRDYGAWLASRPPVAEQRAIELMISLAAEYGTRVHIVHLASADALDTINDARRRGVPLSVETCPHYLTFAAEDIASGATAFKCAPPIRERVHRERLWQALADGHIDLIASDHSPAPASMKCLDTGDFAAAWGGVASLQVAASAVATGAAARGLPVYRIAQWMSAAPARLAGLSGRKGAIVAGADADLVFWDADAKFIVNPSVLRHRHAVTPYAGMSLQGRARATMLRGVIVFEDDRLLSANSGRMITSAT
jgi:allantoinase